jgi:protein ECT2
VKNRIGLRELLMDPVQRIPRYTLMFRTMIKHMTPDNPQRAALMAADEIASKIALAEMDDPTKRAAVIHCLCQTVENFPPALYSNARRFLDCVDVEDVPADGVPLVGTSATGNLHASLFLFDDKLVIMKRPGNGEKTGRALAGLDELDKMAKAGGLPTGLKRTGMVCKGVVDITDVVAVDAGGSGLLLNACFSSQQLILSTVQIFTYT